MIRDQAFVVAGEAVKQQVECGNVRIVKGAIDPLGSFVVPTGPSAPLKVAPVIASRQFVGLVVEETFADAVFFLAVLILQAAPNDAIAELLQLLEFFFVVFDDLFPAPGHPGAPTARVPQAGSRGSAL